MTQFQVQRTLAALMISLSIGTGCTHSIHLVHVSDFAPHKPVAAGKLVQAKSEQFTIMGFVSDTKYVDQAYAAIQAKCPNGEIQGVTTQYSTSHGFFSWTNKILIRGLCLTN